MEPLFVTSAPLELVKVALEVSLPEDPNLWPQEVLQELYKQVPYIADFDPHINMDRVDAEQGYGFGYVEVMNKTEMQAGENPQAMEAAGVRQVRLPVVIKDGKLAAFDIMVTDDSKVLPLTEARLRSAIFRPQAFDVTSRTPGDQSMIGQLYPPYRQNYGFGGGGVAVSAGMGKEGSSLEHEFMSTYRKGDLQAGLSDLERYLVDGGGRIAPHLMASRIREASRSKEAALITGNTRTERAVSGGGAGGLLGTVGGAAAGLGAGLLAGKRNPAALMHMAGHGATHGGYLGGALGAGIGALSSGQKTAGAIDDFIAENEKTGKRGRQSAWSDSSTGALWDSFIAKCASSGLSLLQAVVPSITRSDFEDFCGFCTEHADALHKNAAALLPSYKLILENEPGTGVKTASILSLVAPTVTQVTRVGGGQYAVKSANARYWDPTTVVLDRGSVVKQYGDKVALAADLAGSATMAEEPELPAEDSDTAQAAPIEESGQYRVRSVEGEELIGVVITNLVDVDGAVLPLSLFTNGSQSAIQTDMVGVPAGEGEPLPTADRPSGTGFFFGPASVPGVGEIQATIPLTIKGSFNAPQTGASADPTTYQAETFDGRPVQVSLQPNLQGVQGIDGEMLVPEGWQWSPMGQAEAVTIESAEPEIPEGGGELPPAEGDLEEPPADTEGKTAAAPLNYRAQVAAHYSNRAGRDDIPAEVVAKQADIERRYQRLLERRGENRDGSLKHAEVVVRSGGPGSWSFSGAPVSKLAYEQTESVDIDQAMFLLAAMGVHQGFGAEKLAEAITGRAPVRIKVAHGLTPAAERLEESFKLAAATLESLPNLKCNLWKEAATITDPSAVDTVLSLGFINPENMMTFIGYMPVIEDSQQKLCELLLATRLGLSECSVTALERAVRTTEEVLEGLKSMAFQQE